MLHPRLDVDLVRRMVAGRMVGCEIVHRDMLASTMDEARSLAEHEAPEGAVVVVEEQTVGRGRFDRAWVSPRSQNLSFSVILRPTAAQLPYVNMAAALAVVRAVEKAAGLAATIKWPNDVRVGGRKLSGILIETVMAGREVDHAVIGIGINVNFDPAMHPEIAETATSLYRETGRKKDRSEVLGSVLSEMDRLYDEVKAGRPLTGEWSAVMETLGRTVRVGWKERVLEGRAERVDDQGNLILTVTDGTSITVSAGEVTSQV